MQKKFLDKKIFNRKTIIILSVVVCIFVIIALFSNSISDVVKEAVKPDQSKLSQTYNASRYFFRVGYPDDWYVEKDVNGFGFKKDNDQGLVIRMFNKEDSEKTDSATGVPVQPPENSVTDTQVSGKDYTTVINFFYRGIEDGDEILSMSDEEANVEACKRYIDEFVSGMMYGDEYEVKYKFGNIMKNYVADNQKFSCVTYRCEVYRYTIDTTGKKVLSDKPIEVYNGELYTASRSMAYYAVNFESSLDTASGTFSEYRKDFVNILNDFRFSVFDD